MYDSIIKVILNVIEKAGEPLETKEIQEKVEETIQGVTRTKLFYRLNMLRGDGLVKGKFVGPGKGVWIWWIKSSFFNEKGGKK